MEVCRGDIFEVVNWVRVSGSEQTANRPAVIVSNDIGNMHSNICEVVYLTTSEKKPLPTHADVMCKLPSKALCEQIVTISQDRLGEYIRSCSDAEMKEIDKALMISLGLDLPSVTDVPAVQRVCNQEIDDLKMKLEGAERALDEAGGNLKHEKAICHALQKELGKLKSQPICTLDSDEVVRLKAQIEVLEKQNERLLDRLIG